MLAIALIVLSILFLCGLPVELPLAICSLCNSVVIIVIFIMTTRRK